MIKKFLFPLIFSLILVLPAYTSIAPTNAPVSGKGKISSPAKQQGQVLVIRTAKDPKVQETKVGQKGEILIPQSTTPIPTSASGNFPQYQAEAGNPQGAGAGGGAQSADEGKDPDKSKDSSVSASATMGIGSDSGTSGIGEDSPTGSLFSGSPSNINDGGLLGGGVPSGFTTVPPPPPPPPIPPTLPTTQLQTLIDQSVSDAGVPGAIVAVQTRWGTWIGAAGKADLTASQPMTTDMQVRLAGGTKLFTAALIMKLVEENKISLKDTVDKWLPGQVWNGDRITVTMLLNHTSGIHDHETTQEFVDSLFWGPTIPWTADDVLWITDSYLPDFDPGADFEFCNTGYYLLGMIAEAATGDTVENLTQSRLFSPLGLTRSALTPSGLKTAPYSRDYCWFGVPEYPNLMDASDWDLSWDWTSGSGLSTAQDMLTWIKALFGSKVVNSQSLLQMTTPQAPATTYGFGLEVVSPDTWFGEKLYDQSGEAPGSYTRWLYYPNSGRIIFIALNRCDKRFLTTDPPPQVDASKVADSILSGVSSLLIQTQSQ